MPGSYSWNGDKFKEAFAKAIGRRVDSACIYLANQVRADVSQPGTLRYTTTTKKGKTRQSTVYNFTHSRPGNPPFKQTGHFRRSIAWERQGLVGRVGTNLIYGRVLETTLNRPFLLPNAIKHRPEITAILTAAIKPGELPATTSNQFRSGHFGAGAKAAGY